MKTIDRIIFAVIAIALSALAVRAFMPEPVRAARENIQKIDLVRVGGSYIFLSDIVKK